MLRVQRAAERFHTQLEWLDSWHSFNFGRHYRADRVNFGPLRVLNDDAVAPGAGFGTHAHSEMEIVSIVRQGALSHKDSTGGEGVIRRGEVQRMTAGTGVRHSEFNASDEEPVKFLQIWILPNEAKLPPSFEQANFEARLKPDALTTVVSGRPGQGALPMHQDGSIMIGTLARGVPIEHELGGGRRAYLFVMDGRIALGTHTLGRGDAAAAEGVEFIAFDTKVASDVLLIDLP